MRTAAILLLVVLVLAGCTQSKVVQGSGAAPDWRFTDTEGATHSRDSSKGEPTLLFFMATWCGKCQSNAPRLSEIHRDYGTGLHLFTLSHDPTEDADDLRAWKTKYDQDWPHGVDANSAAAKTFGITTQSSLVVLDEEGREVKKWIYAVPSVDEVRSAIGAA